MTREEDGVLLRQFAESESDEAFSELVSRHVNLVYSVALRQIGEPHGAQEVAQAVFIILARKAGQLRHSNALTSWLFKTTRLAARNFLRAELRRKRREQEAYMESTLNDPAHDNGQTIGPLLDTAVETLRESDRQAIVLRFYEGRTLSQVGSALGTTEAAAEKRVSRALEKLRGHLGRRGVKLSVLAIAGALSTHAVAAAPAGLALSISTVAVANQAAISGTMTALVKGTMKTMAWLKFKFAACTGVAVLLAAGAATVVRSQSDRAGKLAAGEILGNSHTAYAALNSYQDQGKTIATLNGATVVHQFSTKLARPSLYRIDWETTTSVPAGMKTTTSKQTVWSDGTGDYLEMLGKTQTKKDRDSALSSATGISGGAAASIPGRFFDMPMGNKLGDAKEVQRLADARLGDVDCYVLSHESPTRSQTVWIGKNDFLVRQIRTVTSAQTVKAALAEAARRGVQTQGFKIPEPQDIVFEEIHEKVLANPPLGPADFKP